VFPDTGRFMPDIWEKSFVSWLSMMEHLLLYA